MRRRIVVIAILSGAGIQHVGQAVVEAKRVPPCPARVSVVRFLADLARPRTIQ